MKKESQNIRPDRVDDLTVCELEVCPSGYSVADLEVVLDVNGRPVRSEAGAVTIPHNSAGTRKELVIVPNGVPPGPPQVINPLAKSPRLYREFADIQPGDTAAMLAFAERYGPLGDPVAAWSEDGKRLVRVEPVAYWTDHAMAMREAIALWDQREAGDEDALGERLVRVKAHGTPCWKYAPPFGRSFRWEIFWWFRLDDWMPFEKTDVTTAAAGAMTLWVDHYLRGNVHPFLTMDPKSKKLVPRDRVRNLLGALWLQYRLDVAEGVRYKECPACQQRFVVNPTEDKRQVRKRFCSDLCKLRDSRRRQAEAVRLRTEGVPPAEIARRTGTKLTTVPDWIRAAKEKG